MEGLIILFIKFQFINQMYQAFRSLYTSILNLNLNFTPLSFVSSMIHIFYDFKSSLYKQRSLCIQLS